MADRVEREIEEILARLDKELPSDGGSTPERQPISFSGAREAREAKVKRSRPPKLRRPGVSLAGMPLEPPTLLFAGAIVMVAGLILSAAVASSLIWLSFAGVLLFIGAFAWSFFRTKPAMDTSGWQQGEPGKVFWRDRYIDVRSGNPSPTDRIRRRFRR